MSQPKKNHNYTLVIPLVPISQNNNVWNSRWRKKDYLELWVHTVWAAALEAKIPKLEGAELEATIFFPDNRRRDYDNYFSPLWKGTLDGLVKAGVFSDDNYKIIRPNTPYFDIDKKNPHTVVTITSN
jgi:Holliday junction resolvase RusA-like endonuclease